MFFDNPKPQSPHDKFVDSFIYFKGYTPQHSIERVVPDGHIYLIFELDGLSRCIYDNVSLKPTKHFSKCWLSGLQKNYISISAKENSEMFVIRFKPGGVLPYLHSSLDEISDTVVDATEFFGDSVLKLREKMIGAESSEDKYMLVNQFLTDHFQEKLTPHPDIFEAIDRISGEPEFLETSMLELIEESAFSKKHFIDLFRKSVGVTPKYFQRILRFNCILPKIQQQEDISWPQISAECGFYDQAHFIKEFKTFSGYNPEAFLVDQKDHGEINFFPIQ